MINYFEKLGDRRVGMMFKESTDMLKN